MKNKILTTFIIYILFAAHVPAYGETSNQEQDGKSIAFGLEQSVPADSSQNISLDAEIKLLFNKNVVNLLCFFLFLLSNCAEAEARHFFTSRFYLFF